MKKIFLLLLIIPLLQLACDRNNNEACESSRFFNVTGIRIIPMASIKRSTGQVYDKPIYDGDSLHLNEYYLDGYLHAEYYSKINSRSFSFLPQALATSPCPNPGYDGSEEQLKNVSLIALGYFSKTIQPGDTMKNAFLMNNRPPSEYLTNNRQNIKDQYFTISLTQKPDSTNYQAFKVVYQLSNGETYEAFTPTVKFY